MGQGVIIAGTVQRFLFLFITLAASMAYAAENATAAPDAPIVIKEQSYQPCVGAFDTAQAIVQSHNLILQATFQPDGTIQSAEVYKGFSKWPHTFHARLTCPSCWYQFQS